MILRHIKSALLRKTLAAAIIAAALSFVSAAFSVAEESSIGKDIHVKDDSKKKPPKMEHEGTQPGELCVTCHMESKQPDPESITPKIDSKHDICNKCHQEDGTTTGHCGCEDASDPMDCEQCHTTPATGDNPSTEEMNALCLKCHQQA
jgi:predicted CXXCH cytochrome family protein